MPDSLETPIWGAPGNMGCIAAATTATVGKYGRHVPFSYHLGVPYLFTIAVLLAAMQPILPGAPHMGAFEMFGTHVCAYYSVYRYCN